MNLSSLPASTPPAVVAYAEAQKIAFGPVVFQVVQTARQIGLLSALAESAPQGLTAQELATASKVSLYAIRVLADTALSAGVFTLEGERYRLSSVGSVLHYDEMTQANCDFVDDVCYRALAELRPSLQEGKAAGLSAFGDWATVYEGLSQLPAAARASWLRFDHLYSDSAFPTAVRHVATRRPRRLLDIGGNTGRWARLATATMPELEVTIADLPSQLRMAATQLEDSAVAARIHLHAVNVLASDAALPGGFDVVWMSQFLVCFSLPEILKILLLAKTALSPTGEIIILDTYWDRQSDPIAAYCIINTSPYFSCLANGNSRMYTFADIEPLLSEAGLQVRSQHDGIGLGHSLLTLSPS